jgi:hypothetical protein
MRSCPSAFVRSVRFVTTLGLVALFALSATAQTVKGKPSKGTGAMRFRVPPQTCIGFEGLPKGTRLASVSTPEGVVTISALNPAFGPSVNAAVVFDSANPNMVDRDLGTPNEDFGGPGQGTGGESGSPFQNDRAKGNILIVAENLRDDNGDGLIDVPNDADLVGERITFDFSAIGAVEVDSLFFIDMEMEEPITQIRFFNPSGVQIGATAAPAPGDNGVVQVNYNAQNVRRIVIDLNGSAGVDDICFRRMVDCNGNGIQDSKDLMLGTSQDCNGNGIPDECEPDCDADGIPDACEPDCDGDGLPDDCDGPDCDGDGLPDNCDGPDCNANGLPDNCDIAGGAPDCNANGIPDECEPDCDADGIPDACDGPDCNANGLPDNCDIAGGAPDCNANGIPDECEPDCDADGIPDACDGPDCNANGIPDNCDIAGGSPDCDSNGVPDECQSDCDHDGTPDACEPDQDGDGTPDDCEECPPPATACSTGCYEIHSQSGRQLAPPDYGLRIDNLFGPGSGSYTFGFDLPGTGGSLCYDAAGGTVTISGVGFGGKDVGPGWDPSMISYVTLDFVYSGVYCSGNKLIAPSSGLAFGTLLWQASGDVVPLYGQANTNGEFAVLESGDWEGWISLDDNSNTPGTQDWVLDLEPISECPPDPACHGKIGDFVWHDIDRDGLQDPSEPGIEGVTVTLKDGLGNLLATTTTDQDGFYLFQGLCAGDYGVEVDASTLPPDFVASPCNVGTNDAVDNDCSPKPVTLPTNLAFDLTNDFGYNSPCSGLIGDFVWYDLDLDGIQDAGEPGLEGVIVKLKDCADNVLATDTTDAFGYYGFLGLCGGCYKVCIVESTLPPGLTATPCNAGSNDELDNDCSCATVVLSGDHDADTSVDFGYGQACSGVIGDFVWEDADCDGIQDAGESGLEGVLVVLKDEFGNEIASVTTGMDGQYAFTELCLGKYRVVVDESTLPPGYTAAPCNVGSDALDNDCSPEWVDLTSDTDSDMTIDFGYCYYPTIGGEGCTPGYWRQSHHYDSWPAPYTPTTLFSAVFENAFPGKTLGQVLQLGGGGLNALGRHTVAALLNAASPGVDYDLTPAEVIQLFNDLHPGTTNEYNKLKDYFQKFNEQGCPLN